MTDTGRAGWRLRPFQPEDGAAYASLLAASPDTGAIGTAETFAIDPYQALIGIHDGGSGIVAEAPGHTGLAGGACIRPGECQWEGSIVPAALLHTVVVHPDCRRQGLASRLEIEAARQLGEDGVLYAAIQRHNTGSERAARRWANHLLRDRLVFLSLPTRSTRPRGSSAVRAVGAADLAPTVDRMNGFYQHYNLYRPETPGGLAAWLTKTPFEAPYRYYRVAVDKSGEVLAGLAVTETYRLRTTQITRMPAILRILNRIFRVVPADGRLRELTVSRAWFLPGHGRAMRQLLEAVRWEWRQRATTVLIFADVRAPLTSVVGAHTRLAGPIASIAVRAPLAPSEGRLYYYG